MRIPIIRPFVVEEKGECYKNAFEFASHEGSEEAWSIIHGIPRLRGTGEPYGHAWCEIAFENMTWAFDPSSSVFLPADFYRRLGAVDYAVTYSVREACEQLHKFDHWGPWDPRVASAIHRRGPR